MGHSWLIQKVDSSYTIQSAVTTDNHMQTVNRKFYAVYQNLIGLGLITAFCTLSLHLAHGEKKLYFVPYFPFSKNSPTVSS